MDTRTKDAARVLATLDERVGAHLTLAKNFNYLGEQMLTCARVAATAMAAAATVAKAAAALYPTPLARPTEESTSTSTSARARRSAAAAAATTRKTDVTSARKGRKVGAR